MTDLATRRYRSVFISDVHLGTRGCQAELLLDFIRHVEFDRLYQPLFIFQPSMMSPTR